MNDRTVLLDTGPFVVLVVGSVDPDLLGATRHLKQFAPEDWLVLSGFLSRFGAIAIVPHVATEAAHFVTKIGERRGQLVKARLADVLNAVREHPVASRSAAARGEFAWLDLADCALLEAGRPEETLLSTDAVLVNRRLDLGFPAVNFNHLREQAGVL